MQYLPRIYDTVLKRKLRASDAILIEGAKWCGKTTTAEQIAGSRLYMQKPDAREQNNGSLPLSFGTQFALSAIIGGSSANSF